VLKVAIIGCGKIADAHASQIVRIKGCEIVGVCDREPLMAKQLYERMPAKKHYSDLNELFRDAQPDVVHITTPAESHFSVAKFCLEHGAHVYVEKPFTLQFDEAERLLALADSRNLYVTVGHDDQFSHAARRMRALIKGGYLGGRPVHMDSTFCYDLSDPAYARALLSDKNHWVRKLPGKLLQNIISHGVARIAEFLSSENPEVMAYGFVSPLLRSMHETEIIDELRVIIGEDGRTTAYFTFSSQMRPTLHEFRIFGPKNGLLVDQDQETVIKLTGDKMKSYAEKFVPPVLLASQFVGNVKTNMRTFLKRDFQMKSGMKYLIEAFYKAIQHNSPVPIPYREILLTAKIMDQIFQQLDKQRMIRPARSWDHKALLSELQ
jgi:predicted dehydrogenase